MKYVIRLKKPVNFCEVSRQMTHILLILEKP